MKAIISTILIFFIIATIDSRTEAQNLVENGSFEIFYKGKCPEIPRSNDKNVKLIPAWTWPTIEGTTDYFNACSKGISVGVPKNLMGYAEAADGDGYVGCILKSNTKGKKNYREYLQTKLKEPLKKDQIYCVSFHYRLANCSAYSIDKMGVFFGDKEEKIATSRYISYQPQLQNPENKFMDNDDQWRAFYFMYTATGNEQYMIIGNFWDDEHTNMKKHSRSNCHKPKDYAYYYIDSVQVMPIKWNCEPCTCIPQDLKVEIERGDCFNGGTDLFAKVSGGSEPYRIFEWENGLTSQKFKHAITGTHKIKVMDDWGCEAEAEITYDCGQPLTAEVKESNYTGGKNGYIKLKVKGGIAPFKFKWNNNMTTKDISGLSFGTYIYTVTDKQGAEYTDTVKFKVPELTVDVKEHYTDTTDGYIHLTVKTGLPPYKYKWNTGDTIPNLDNLSAGTYSVTITDAAEQIITKSIQFVEPIKVEVEKGYTFEEDGFVNLKIKGGCKPYTIKWSNDSTKASMKFIDNGLYEYKIVGSCGKTAQDTVRIKGNIILNNVLFKTGSAVLLAASFPELDRVVTYMNRKTKIRVEISGHTDNVGGDDYNKKLSEKRAKSVVEYISKKGISEERLQFKGYGKEKPIATNKTKEGRALNRRVEFEIIE